jgi:hypothetical protein
MDDAHPDSPPEQSSLSSISRPSISPKAPKSVVLPAPSGRIIGVHISDKPPRASVPQEPFIANGRSETLPVDADFDEEPSFKFLGSFSPYDLRRQDPIQKGNDQDDERLSRRYSAVAGREGQSTQKGLRPAVTPYQGIPPLTRDTGQKFAKAILPARETSSWISVQSAISVGSPLLQYDFHSTRTSPVVRPLFLGSDHLAVTTHLSLENEYRYLEIGPRQIRLLLLSRGRGADSLHCSLKIMSDEQLRLSGIVYQALSYTWGPPDDDLYDIFVRDIDIDKDGKTVEEFLLHAVHQVIPRKFYIRSNLYNALKQLRSMTEDLWFWIDAICIDQSNNIEKSHQLEKMLDIYCNAHNVCVWIGDGEPGEVESIAMDFIPNIINLKVLDRMISGVMTNEEMAVSCSAFAKLLRRPWFGRRWVIQEVAAARLASVQCGSKKINWIDFADAVDLFMANIDGIRLMYSKSHAFKDDPDALNSVESAGAKAIVSSTNNVLRKAQDGTVLDRLWSIESLVMTFLHFEATDPRDTIYALLALANDGHFSSPLEQLPALTPDYTKDAAQTYMDFFRHCITVRDSLDIICRHWALPLPNIPSRRTHRTTAGTFPILSSGSGTAALPSWIGLVSDSSFGPPSKFTGRLNGDSLVGEPGHAIYNASRGMKMVALLGQRTRTQQGSAPSLEFDGRLCASGMMIGQVIRVTSRVVDGTIPDDCLEIAGWNRDDDINNIPDRLWRTLIADRASNGRSPPPWYRRACMYCLKKTSPEGDLNTAKLIANVSLPNTVNQFLKRVQAVVWSRKFLVCRDLREESGQLFGLGSRYTREGDIVCLLYGCSVPVVLRPVGESHHEVVGECYIHGKMDGESIAAMNMDAIIKATMTFDII